MSQNFDPNQNYYSFIDNNTDPLVFIHGVGLDHKMWQPQIDSLNDHSIITYDLLGHGKTPYKKKEVTLNDFSSQLDDLIKFLKVDKIHLIGFSLELIQFISFLLFVGIQFGKGSVQSSEGSFGLSQFLFSLFLLLGHLFSLDLQWLDILVDIVALKCGITPFEHTTCSHVLCHNQSSKLCF
mgnify:CR=1 FL=1